MHDDQFIQKGTKIFTKINVSFIIMSKINQRIYKKVYSVLSANLNNDIKSTALLLKNEISRIDFTLSFKT